MRARAGAAALAGAVVALTAAAPAQAGFPASIAALGDSLTTAWGSAGAKSDNQAASWSTGTEPGVDSHYLRLLRRTLLISGRVGNYAVAGSKMAATATQADSAVAQRAEYVTVLSGTNDVCRAGTVEQMTSVVDFTTQLRGTLTKLTSKLPTARILLGSIPDWYGHYLRFQTDSAATTAWAATNVCRLIFGAGTASADREAARQRIADLNVATAAVCREFAVCSFADLSGLAFERADLAFDFFHLSPAGQARLAATLWAATPWGRPAALLDFSAAAGTEAVSLFWSHPAEGVARVRVVQKAGSPPAHPDDGSVVHDASGTSGGVTVTGLGGGVAHHYAAWTYDVDGVASDPARVQAVPAATPGASRVRDRNDVAGKLDLRSVRMDRRGDVLTVTIRIWGRWKDDLLEGRSRRPGRNRLAVLYDTNRDGAADLTGWIISGSRGLRLWISGQGQRLGPVGVARVNSSTVRFSQLIGGLLNVNVTSTYRQPRTRCARRCVDRAPDSGWSLVPSPPG